jgi:hypothetical protein
MRRGVWVLVVVFSVVSLLVGCWNPFSAGNGGNGNGGKEINRETPDNLLEFFATAYEDRDIDLYMEALDDFYQFTFLEADWEDAGVDAENPYWGKTRDVTSTDQMFDDPEVKGIEMSFTIDVPWDICTETIWSGEDTTEVSGVCAPLITPDIKVHTEVPGEEPLTYWVNKSWISVMVIPDRHNTNLWTILRIEEISKE